MPAPSVSGTSVTNTEVDTRAFFQDLFSETVATDVVSDDSNVAASAEASTIAGKF